MRTKVERVLTLLSECGFIYSLIWLVGLVTAALGGGKITDSVYNVIGQSYHCIAGIYPTFIVFAVAMQKLETQSFIGSAAAHSIAFARQPDEVTTPS